MDSRSNHMTTFQAQLVREQTPSCIFLPKSLQKNKRLVKKSPFPNLGCQTSAVGNAHFLGWSSRQCASHCRSWLRRVRFQNNYEEHSIVNQSVYGQSPRRMEEWDSKWLWSNQNCWNSHCVDSCKHRGICSLPSELQEQAFLLEFPFWDNSRPLRLSYPTEKRLRL